MNKGLKQESELRTYESELDKSLIELKLASGMTAKARLQDLADVQRLIQHNHVTADFAKQLHPYVRRKFLELLS